MQCGDSYYWAWFCSGKATKKNVLRNQSKSNASKYFNVPFTSSNNGVDNLETILTRVITLFVFSFFRFFSVFFFQVFFSGDFSWLFRVYNRPLTVILTLNMAYWSYKESPIFHYHVCFSIWFYIICNYSRTLLTRARSTRITR